MTDPADVDDIGAWNKGALVLGLAGDRITRAFGLPDKTNYWSGRIDVLGADTTQNTRPTGW